MKLDTLQKLYVDELRDLYNAENQLLKALPKMAKAATHAELRAAFEEHLAQTRGHVARLDEIAAELEVSSLKGKKCRGMEGIIEEGKERIDELEDEMLDAGLIEAAQKVEHYEIAGYGTARAHARLLGLSKVAKLLQQTLDEEGKTDKKLTELAENVVNRDALQGA